MHFWGVDNMWTLLQYNKNLVIFPIKKEEKILRMFQDAVILCIFVAVI